MSDDREIGHQNAGENSRNTLTGSAGAVIDSRHLFAHRKEVTIRHGGADYRILVTRNGKLIINK
ncbi:MAG: hemin uptake protein HemP [Lentisphaerae bacterium]|nr:hemin uptake protein HemP [Lentisphaerota bacterium]